MSPFDAPGDGSEDEGTFYSLASEYLEAAITLFNTPPTRINYWIVIYYLLGHSAELTLKSYLFDHGETPKSLKKIGHDLDKLVSCALSHGLSKKLSFRAINSLAPIYGSKELEYRKRKRQTFPSEEDLIEEIHALQSTVFDRIFRWENGQPPTPT